ncbi:aminoglycoside phosphotransferase family protein [Arthrobacter agilis]|uniref:phosphotransferase n=1 Tax=Arthrobacter agilis TaxID=37921 RepID=UPI000B35D333|nr:phosphotransferase [Arthrobacter agilis]OUM41432.1 hypothetical protein B8W74_11075 [Arthrobacter agilis]PPB46237.1 aminoglycoside phosphotransferase [Arthrobacter agilis]TPV26991.1 aminoglycoside phosphotransferase family protein [Arthrobacter agilis]VDR32870.1 Aminoglycoside phosphotransferase [Arthrobacter agilis]
MKARETRSRGERAVLAFLRYGDPARILRRALDADGWTLVAWRPATLHHRPGAGVTGIFPVEVSRTEPAPAMSPPSMPTHVCITSCAVPGAARPSGPESRVVDSAGGGGELTAWVHPRDPLLPGLPASLDPDRAAGIGFGPGGTPGDAVVEIRSYRPLRRAVVVVRVGSERRYLKVLRQGAAGPLAARHRLLRNAGVPVPELVGAPTLDVLALRSAPGTPLAELFMADGAAGLAPHELVRTLRSLPGDVLSLPARAPWSARIRDYGEGAAAALPAHARRIRRLAASIDDAVRASSAGPLVPSHGDFYEGNLLIDDGRVSGLLDVDAVGPGHLVDDLACFIGHLAVLPGLHAGYSHVPEALTRFLSVFDTYVDLQLSAAGPPRSVSPWLPGRGTGRAATGASRRRSPASWSRSNSSRKAGGPAPHAACGGAGTCEPSADLRGLRARRTRDT